MVAKKIDTSKIKPRRATKRATAKKTAVTLQIRVDPGESWGNWSIGDVTVNDHRYWFEVKHYVVGSKYGIDNGCVSELWIKGPGGEVLYDRGWYKNEKPDINPELLMVYYALLERFNNGILPIDRERMISQGALMTIRNRNAIWRR